MNDSDDIVLIKWSFSPPHFFEQKIIIERANYMITINDGQVEARIKAKEYDQSPDLEKEIDTIINNYFLGSQLLSLRPYKLFKDSMCRLNSDGSKHVYSLVGSLALGIALGVPDIYVTDQYGNVIQDTRKERLEAKKRLSELSGKYCPKDLIIASMLKSYNDAVNDPINELVHLYQIRDSIAKFFGGESKAKKILGITNKQWSRLGKLANEEPLKQGRHRGKNPSFLREATQEELREARTIAFEMINAYFNYLERFTGKSKNHESN